MTDRWRGTCGCKDRQWRIKHFLILIEPYIYSGLFLTTNLQRGLAFFTLSGKRGKKYFVSMTGFDLTSIFFFLEFTKGTVYWNADIFLLDFWTLSLFTVWTTNDTLCDRVCIINTWSNHALLLTLYFHLMPGNAFCSLHILLDMQGRYLNQSWLPSIFMAAPIVILPPLLSKDSKTHSLCFHLERIQTIYSKVMCVDFADIY